MEYRRHSHPSESYPSHQLSLDGPNGPSSRQPVSDSVGNVRLHGLAPVGIYHERNGYQHRVERSMSMPTLLLQPVRQPIAKTLKVRHQSTRRQQHIEYSRNPIVGSPQYQVYRARQSQEGNLDDAKWPPTLEIAFLDGNCRLS
jgi:hypothetical protein